VNVPVVAPAATVAVAGTVAEVELEVRLTVCPPVAAGPLRVIVPVEDDPPDTVAGLSDTVVTTGAVIDRLAVEEMAPTVAVIVAEAFAETADVVTVKVPVVAPAATVTEAGTVALVLFEARVTTVPPVGAAALSVTVPAEDVPPITVDGATDTVTFTPVPIVSTAVEAVPCSDALIVAEVVDATLTVVTVAVADELPAGTVTLAGIVAAALFDDRLTN